jgi:molecular chaperone GrpE
VSDQEPNEEGVRVTDRRRIDPDTYEVRPGEARPADIPSDGLNSAVEAELEGEITEVEAKVIELTSDLQRVHAEYANYRKRVDRDRELVRDMAVAGVIAELLPMLDDIERAREHGELDGAFKSVGEALEATTTKIGLERFGTAGEDFDPMVHEALTSEAVDGIETPTVMSVYQPGYRFAGRVLRPARVAVAGTD